MKRVLRFFGRVIAVYFVIVAVLSVAYWVMPPVSTLMLARVVTLQSVSYSPTPLTLISPHLVRTVIRAEDSRFCEHNGIDWQSLEEAIDEASADKRVRGASTIPMQVTKNLFLWPQKSYVRKVIELPMTLALDLLWSKARMMEIYLSVAEWGDGIFGVEAAAQTYFNRSASELSRYESALLAAALPNPKERNPRRPSSYHVEYATRLMNSSGSAVDTSCLK